MILGLGSDLVDIRRIESTLDRFGERFTGRIFTERERQAIERRSACGRLRGAGYAKRFAAKEACAKALGTGFRQGVFWKDLEVASLPTGKPFLILSGGALARLQAMTPEGMAASLELTLTDEYPLAQAVVILSAMPREFGLHRSL
ncbi:MAG: holo-ACP synthase [Alphaproteobacteria bacterium]